MSTRGLQQRDGNTPQKRRKAKKSKGPARNGAKSRVKVVVRVRPTIDEDRNNLLSEEDGVECVAASAAGHDVVLSRPFYPPKEFEFDCVLGPKSSQESVYDAVARDIVRDTMQGFNATVMCYGQTGAGKTYTIFGDSSSPDITEGSGVVARVAEDLFSNVAVEQAKGAQVRIDLSLVQVYMEGIQDLLGDTPNKNLPLREDPHAGIFVEGLRLVPIASPADVADALEAGARNRTTALTRQNGSSSRSHAILRFYISQYHTLDDQENTGGSRVRLKRSVLTIVDLAGSERVAKSGSVGLRLEEAKKINKSISAVGNCVAALTAGVNRTHVPVRDSVLTRMLSDAFGGNSKTVLCANVGPMASSYEETFGTLNFAKRAMAVRNHVTINESVKEAPPASASSSSGGAGGEGGEGGAMVVVKSSLASSERAVQALTDENHELKSELSGLRAQLEGSQAEAEAQAQGAARQSTTMTQLRMQESWENREHGLVDKFTSIIHNLQVEIAKQNVIIAQLQQRAAVAESFQELESAGAAIMGTASKRKRMSGRGDMEL